MALIRSLAAGNLDQVITIQQRPPGQNARGQALESWVPVLANIYAQAEPVRGREFFAAGQMQSEVTVVFRIRYRSNITTAMRVVWRGQPHDIVAVIDPHGQRQMLELMCVSGTRDGR